MERAFKPREYLADKDARTLAEDLLAFPGDGVGTDSAPSVPGDGIGTDSSPDTMQYHGMARYRA